MRKTLIICVLTLLTMLPAAAQKFSLSGRVVEKESGEPVEFATVVTAFNDDEPASARDLPSLRGKYVRAKYRYLASKGVLQYPDANSTMRLTYGRVLPLRPWDGVYVHWQSTARGLREKYVLEELGLS